MEPGLFVSQDTWDQVLRNVLSGDRLPNRARTLGTRFLGRYPLAVDFLIETGLWDQALWNVPSGDILPKRARTLGSRFLGTYPCYINFQIEPGHLRPGS